MLPAFETKLVKTHLKHSNTSSMYPIQYCQADTAVSHCFGTTESIRFSFVYWKKELAIYRRKKYTTNLGDTEDIKKILLVEIFVIEM